jgi:hypothetical protein
MEDNKGAYHEPCWFVCILQSKELGDQETTKEVQAPPTMRMMLDEEEGKQGGRGERDVVPAIMHASDRHQVSKVADDPNTVDASEECRCTGFNATATPTTYSE